MTEIPIFASFFPEKPLQVNEALPQHARGKVYADVPHRYFHNPDALKSYIRDLKKIGVNVLLLLPHFFPSFSEYIVKNFEKPCPLFGSWKVFADVMTYAESLGMDRMIDIPFNHADWQAENLSRSWFMNADEKGTEAGADDTDADGNIVRINWGGYVLDNSKRELLDYWLQKVIFPHVSQYHVNAIRIDAAWGLDPKGLSYIVKETKARFPHVWFLAENLGMARLIKLAKSGIAAGGERYFNNMYWYEKGRYIPADIHRFFKISKGKPSCSLFSSHDVLMPAMRSMATLRSKQYGKLNEKALHRQIVEREGITSLTQISPDEQRKIIRLMKLDFIISALLSTDVMFAAGSEKCLLERVNVLTSSPEHFNRGINSDLPSFMATILRAKFSDTLFNTDGVIIPFGNWERDKTGCKGFIKRSSTRILMTAVNTNLSQAVACPIPDKLRRANSLAELAPDGYRLGASQKLDSTPTLLPGQATVLYTPFS